MLPCIAYTFLCRQSVPENITKDADMIVVLAQGSREGGGRDSGLLQLAGLVTPFVNYILDQAKKG